MSFIKRNFDPKRHKQYIPRNPKKYTGSYPIICRSSWETIFCRYCDSNQKILYWNSEKVVISYKHPYLTNRNNNLPKTSRYYPDFLITVQESPTKVMKYLVEIKPFKETQPPKAGNRKSQKTRLYEKKTWAVNSAKWKAAERYCKRMGYKFIKLTEKQLLR